VFREGCALACLLTLSAPCAETVDFAVRRTVMGTPVRATALLVHPDELTAAWIDRAADLGVGTLSIHPCGGAEAVRSLEDLLVRCGTPAFRDLIDRAYERGLRVEYEAHVGSWLVPRDLFRDHPEYFRADATGARRKDFNFCVSNPEALAQVVRRTKQLARGLYRSHPRYALWLDDVPDAVCQCAACRALGASDQQLLVLNRMLGALREVVPEAQLAYLAYFNTMHPPRKIRPAEGIFLEYAPINRTWDRPVAEQGKVVDPAELAGLLGIFGRENARVLEYWFDNSLFSKWRKPERKFTPRPAVLEKDLAWYAARGFGEVSSFACFLGPAYERRWGVPDLSSFKLDREVVLKGLHASAGGRDGTEVKVSLGADDRLNFSFKVRDVTPTRIAAFTGERDVDTVDRVELYLSPTVDLSKRYWCLEMTPQGYVHDYSAESYRRFDEGWRCRTLTCSGRVTADGYEVTGSLAWRELRDLGLTRSGLHLGVYRADFAAGGKLVSWLSALPIISSPDFHRPGTLFPF